jgi:hypothetical protein
MPFCILLPLNRFKPSASLFFAKADMPFSQLLRSFRSPQSPHLVYYRLKRDIRGFHNKLDEAAVLRAVGKETGAPPASLFRGNPQDSPQLRLCRLKLPLPQQAWQSSGSTASPLLELNRPEIQPRRALSLTPETPEVSDAFDPQALQASDSCAAPRQAR